MVTINEVIKLLGSNGFIIKDEIDEIISIYGSEVILFKKGKEQIYVEFNKDKVYSFFFNEPKLIPGTRSMELNDKTQCLNKYTNFSTIDDVIQLLKFAGGIIVKKPLEDTSWMWNYPTNYNQ